MKILYYNNCWFTNVGEAFIDIGAMNLLKRVFPHSQIACISEMTAYYGLHSPCKEEDALSDDDILRRCYDPIDVFGADYLVFSGMFACEGFVNECKAKTMADRMKDKGTKIVFLGMGGEAYTPAEVDLCKKYFEIIKPELIVTRDNITYENYKDVVTCLKGIDSAFWVNESFDPRGFAEKKYDVITFNRSREPELFEDWNLPIIRPWHMQYQYRKKYFADGRMISDTPYDYLTIYANAHCVYTDLVHATIPSLVYGVPVKYWYIDKRGSAFDAVQSLEKSDGWLSVRADELERQKRNIEEKICEKINRV